MIKTELMLALRKRRGGHHVNRYDTYIPTGKPRHNIEYFYQALKDEHYNPHIYSNEPSNHCW